MKAYDPGMLIRHEARFSDEELEAALREMFSHWSTELLKAHAPNAVDQVEWLRPKVSGKREPKELSPRANGVYWVLTMLAQSFDRIGPEPPPGDWMALAKVAEVMCR